jgi:proteasome assembly chaperone (PAC2) family protein
MVGKIVWDSKRETLPKHRFAFAAFPGVGNVGKLLVDGLADGLDSEKIASLFHPDMPPQANLIDGLLTPPHLSMYSIDLGKEKILTITGEAQPLSTSGQYEMAETILATVADLGCEFLLVLAGLSSEPTCEDVFAICADLKSKELFSKGGGDIATDKPAGGVIGLAGLLASMGPVNGISSGCVVAATIGSSVDIHAGERLRLALQKWLNLKLPIPIATTEAIAERIESLVEKYPDAEMPNDFLSEEPSTLYA